MNKIEKLEFKHLCGYLPYDISFEDKGHFYVLTTDVLARREKTNTLKYIKPLLIPLSSLTEQLPDGSVPIVELAKIAGLKSSEYTTEEQDGTIVVFGKEIRYPGSNNAAKFFFELEIDNCDMDKGIEFLDPCSYDFSPLNNQIQLFEYIFSIHADVYGLIDSGLAIDKRTI